MSYADHPILDAEAHTEAQGMRDDRIQAGEEAARAVKSGAGRYSDWLTNYRDQCTFGEYLKHGPPEPDNDCSSCIGTGIGNPHTGSNCWSCNGSGSDKSQRGASRWSE